MDDEYDLAERIAAYLASKREGYSVTLTYGMKTHTIQADKVSTKEHYVIVVAER